jgi:hypothetical protein
MADPHNFALELAATAGMFALLGGLIFFGGFYWLVLRNSLRTDAAETQDQQTPGTDGTPTPEKEPTRWGFYLWAMTGLFLGYALKHTGESPAYVLLRIPQSEADAASEATLIGLVAAFRGVIWFAAFALFVGVRWPGRVMAAALATGVTAVLLNLSVSGGIGAPNVMTLLVAAMAVGLAGLALTPWRSDPDSWLARALPLPLVIGFFLAFVVHPLDPVIRGMALATRSAQAARELTEDRAAQRSRITDPRQQLAERAVKPIKEAIQADPGNVRWHVQMSELTLQLYWDSLHDGRRLWEIYGVEAHDSALLATKKDPKGLDGYRALVRVRTVFARQAKGPGARQQQLRLACDWLRTMAKIDTTNPWIHYERAGVCRLAGLGDESREAAASALKWDRLISRPPRKLGDWQRLEMESLLTDTARGK